MFKKTHNAEHFKLKGEAVVKIFSVLKIIIIIKLVFFEIWDIIIRRVSSK